MAAAAVLAAPARDRPGDAQASVRVVVAVRSLLGAVCVCSHGEGMHAFGTRKADLGQRTSCSVSTGPRGVPCDCTHFEPVQENE